MGASSNVLTYCWLMPKTSISWKSIWIYLKLQIWKKLILAEMKMEWCHVCVFKDCPCCIQPYHMIKLNTCTWYRSAVSMFEMNFQTGWKKYWFWLDFQIAKLDIIFKTNSNGFSTSRSFAHWVWSSFPQLGGSWQISGFPMR